MTDEREEIREEETEDNSEDNREEETSDEIRDEDYVNDDEIEMDRSMEKRLDGIEAKLDSIFDTISMFVDSGAVIRENDPEITAGGDDFAEDFMTIDELDFSLD